jgi:hypothetical protein
MNARDLPSRIRTSLICTVDHHEYGKEREDVFIAKLTHCKRKLRSICLIASRRKPAPPVVYPVVRQRTKVLLGVTEAKYPQNPVRPVVHVFLDFGVPEVDLRLWLVLAVGS